MKQHILCIDEPETKPPFVRPIFCHDCDFTTGLSVSWSLEDPIALMFLNNLHKIHRFGSDYWEN